MSTYAIGDIHGCYPELIALLKKIEFDPEQDCLWFAGDLVNRGGYSLEVLRFIKDLGSKHHVVLGNNDLSLLSVYYGFRKHCQKKYLKVLESPDCGELIEWLSQQKILHYDPKLNFVITHAGIYPFWDLKESIQYAREVESVLQGNQRKAFLGEMFGNEPVKWSNNLTGWDRYRFIINVFSRMRYCTEDGALDFVNKGPLGTQKEGLIPWYCVDRRKKIGSRLIFGHWASLLGKLDIDDPDIFALDTGCGWGLQLTALRLEDLRRFSVEKQ